MQGRKVPGRKEKCQIQTEQEIQKKSGIQRTARARKVTNNIGNAIGTEAVEGTEAIENTEVTDDTESTEATEAIEETENTEETEQPELKTVFDYSNDAVRVVVTLSNETDLPAGAELVVAPVAVTAEMEASIDKA